MPHTAGVIAAAVFLVPIAASAQVPGQGAQAKPAPPDSVRSITVLPMRVPLETRLVTGAPYMAELEIEHVQTLGDGNRIVNRTTGRVFRDRDGRTRREEDRESGHVGSIAITDPVAGHAYSMDPETRTAWRSDGRRTVYTVRRDGAQSASADPAELQRRRIVEAELAAQRGDGRAAQSAPRTEMSIVVAPTRDGATPAWEPTTERLAARDIGGVMAEGTRITRTIPAGAIGNEQPIVIVTEEWTSPELQVLVMTRVSDPRTGESTYRLANIVRSDPSPSLFDVPADYTVRDAGVTRVVTPPVKTDP